MLWRIGSEQNSTTSGCDSVRSGALAVVEIMYFDIALISVLKRASCIASYDSCLCFALDSLRLNAPMVCMHAHEHIPTSSYEQ